MRFLIFLILAVLACADGSMPGGRRAINLTDAKQLEKIEKLSKYGVETIATRRMEAAKSGVSSSANTVLKYNHRVLSAQSQVVAG